MNQPQSFYQPPQAPAQPADGSFWFFSAPKDLEPKGEQRNFFLAGGDLLAYPAQTPPPAVPSQPPAADSAAASAFRPAGGFFTPGDPNALVNGNPPQYPPAPGPYSYGPALQVRIQQKTVQHGKKTLLRDIAFDVQHGDFVLILGGSGAGKTTLIRAILGESRADGQIYLNGQDLYTNFASMKSQIGLVPQFLTLRLNDTVRNTVTDAAYVRLGHAFSKEEILQRVDSVLEKVGITALQDSLIGNLSGGQKKKVSVAVQLVGFQRVFICDEPDSGLDAASRVQLMQLLKEISMTGKIVMVITHYPDDALGLFSRVVVLAKGSADKCGHLAYEGTVDGALKTFGVSHLQDIMKEINPPYEGGKGLADQYINHWNEVRRV